MMTIRTEGAALQLARGQLAHLADPRPLRLACRSGVAWITIDHDLRDIVLEAGDSCVVAADAALLVHALREDTALAVSEA